MRFIIHPYKINNATAKRLQKSIQDSGHTCLRVYPDRQYKPQDTDIIINWGSSRLPNWFNYSLYHHNNPVIVSIAIDKLSTLNFLNYHNVPIPEYTVNKDTAIEWSRDHKVFCRTLINSSSGNGIVIATNPEEIVDAPLYTKNVNKKQEFRVHVFGEQIIDVVEKKKRNGTGPRQDVWNHLNDFVFARQNINVPSIVLETGLKAVKTLGLTFGAVDVGYNLTDNQCWVFEVNTAPGLTGTTLKKYTDSISNLRRHYD